MIRRYCLWGMGYGGEAVCRKDLGPPRSRAALHIIIVCVLQNNCLASSTIQNNISS